MMKKLFATFIVIMSLAIRTVSAQFSRPITIGAGAGVTYGLADLKIQRLTLHGMVKEIIC